GPRGERVRCAVGAEWSFERCARFLREVAGLVVCDNTVRKVCDHHGGRMRAWQRDDPAAARPFRRADGDVEFQTDGTMVNTTGGWREVRLSIFAKRRRGRPVTDPDDWDDQRLPAPHVRVATAAVRTGAALGPQWRRPPRPPGGARAAALTAPAGGAKGDWGGVERRPPGAAGVLDVYHAGGQVFAAAGALFGEGTPAGRAWAERRRRTLLRSGAEGLLGELAAEPGDVSGLVGYLTPHVGHTPYRRRLAEGR